MIDDALNKTDSLLDDLFDDVEEIEVTPSPEIKDEVVKPDTKPEPEEEEEVIQTDTVSTDDILNDAFSDEESDEEEEEKGDEDKKSEVKPEKKKPGRKPKNETYTREEALVAAAKRFGEIFGISDEDVPFDTLDEQGVVDFIDQVAEQLQVNTYNEIKNSDEITKTLLEYKDNGGDPLEILELYKQKEEVFDIDIKSESGQKQVVQKFMKETLNWTQEEIDDYIDTLSSSEKLEKEAERLKSKFDAHFEQQKQEKLERQKQIQKRELQLLQQKEAKFDELIDSHKISKKETAELKKLAFGKGTLKGKVIDIIDYKIAQIQNDPAEYLELVRFINNKEEYIKTKQQDLINSQNNDNFKKALNIQSRRKNDTTPTPSSTNKPKKNFTFNL